MQWSFAIPIRRPLPRSHQDSRPERSVHSAPVSPRPSLNWNESLSGAVIARALHCLIPGPLLLLFTDSKLIAQRYRIPGCCCCGLEGSRLQLFIPGSCCCCCLTGCPPGQRVPVLARSESIPGGERAWRSFEASWNVHRVQQIASQSRRRGEPVASGGEQGQPAPTKGATR